MPDHKRGTDRVVIPGMLHGEVTVYQPMAVMEMSVRGMLIEADFPLHLGSLHDFRLSLGEMPVVIKGRIVHSQIGELGGELARYRTGVEFVEPSEHAMTAIRGFVEGHRFARAAAPAGPAAPAAAPRVIEAEIADES